MFKKFNLIIPYLYVFVVQRIICIQNESHIYFSIKRVFGIVRVYSLGVNSGHVYSKIVKLFLKKIN